MQMRKVCKSKCSMLQKQSNQEYEIVNNRNKLL